MNYDARFGAAADKAASPWLIYINYVMKETKTRDFTLTVNKD